MNDSPYLFPYLLTTHLEPNLILHTSRGIKQVLMGYRTSYKNLSIDIYPNVYSTFVIYTRRKSNSGNWGISFLKASQPQMRNLNLRWFHSLEDGIRLIMMKNSDTSTHELRWSPLLSSSFRGHRSAMTDRDSSYHRCLGGRDGDRNVISGMMIRNIMRDQAKLHATVDSFDSEPHKPPACVAHNGSMEETYALAHRNDHEQIGRRIVEAVREWPPNSLPQGDFFQWFFGIVNIGGSVRFVFGEELAGFQLIHVWIILRISKVHNAHSWCIEVVDVESCGVDYGCAFRAAELHGLLELLPWQREYVLKAGSRENLECGREQKDEEDRHGTPLGCGWCCRHKCKRAFVLHRRVSLVRRIRNPTRAGKVCWRRCARRSSRLPGWYPCPRSSCWLPNWTTQSSAQRLISTQIQQQANHLRHHKSLDILKWNFYRILSNHAAGSVSLLDWVNLTNSRTEEKQT